MSGLPPVGAEILAHLTQADAVLGGLIRAVGPCGLETDALGHPFQALARAIAHQQLNGIAANTILRRLIDNCGAGAFPTPQMVLQASTASLRAAGFSFAKITALRDLAEKTLAAVVPDAATLAQWPDEEIVTRLTQVRGIGRWTVEMLLIFHLGRPDVLPVDDFGVRSGFRAAYGLRSMPRPQTLHAWGERWRPYRSVAAWYLWRALELERAGRLPAPTERIRVPRIRRTRRRARPHAARARVGRSKVRVGRAVSVRRAANTRGSKAGVPRSRASAPPLRRAAASSARPRRSGARSGSRRRRAPQSRAPASRR